MEAENACSLNFQRVKVRDPCSSVPYFLLKLLKAVHPSEILFIDTILCAGSPSQWARIGPARDISTDSSRQDCINLAKTWLTKCVETHSECLWKLNDSLLPTLTIEVGSCETEVRLHVAAGEKGEYAALSHCWGSSVGPSLTTTQDTLEDRKRSIEFDAASKSFQHAIEVTRDLGIKYLWIDALCIIQDSKEQWAQETEKMSRVYNNAVVTLYADSARDASQGLFPDPLDRESVNSVFQMPSQGPNGEPVMIRVRPRYQDPTSLDTIYHSAKPLTPSKLSVRGWALQESILSPRELHFAKEEMYWICSTHSRCECKLRPGQASPMTLGRLGARSTSDNEFRRHMYSEWPILVMDFTRRSLTLQSDRLPALAGLADWFAQHTKDSYLCGLWASDMRYGLTWFIKPSGQEEASTAWAPSLNRRMAEPYAPTWSWASVSGPITYYGPYMTQFGSRNPRYKSYDQYEIDICDAHNKETNTPILEITAGNVRPLTQNKYGPVSNAWLKVIGYVLPLQYNTIRNLWLPPTLPHFEHFDPRRLEVMYDVPTEVPDILAAAQVAGRFGLLFVGTRVERRGARAGDQAVCLLLEGPFDGAESLVFPAGVYRRRGLVTRAGWGVAWREKVMRGGLVLV
ncbi:hypothetical protein MMC21_008425 [Puttea exsequens]|nr:hypothetical protein [Puttea exsequens]